MKLERRNWDTSEIIKPLEEHAVFIKSLLDIDDVPPKEKKGHIQLDDFNKRIVNAIIEEGIKGNLDKAQKILEQKLKVEEANGGKNKLPEKVVSEIIPTIKDYFEENNEKIKQDLSAPEKKQPLAEKLKNIDSTTKAPDIQNSVQVSPREVKEVRKSGNLKETGRIDFLDQIVPQEIGENLPKSEIPTGKTSEGVISVVTDKNGGIKLHTNEAVKSIKNKEIKGGSVIILPEKNENIIIDHITKEGGKNFIYFHTTTPKGDYKLSDVMESDAFAEKIRKDEGYIKRSLLKINPEDNSNISENPPEKEVSDIIKPSMEKNIPNNSPESNKFSALEKEAEKIKLQYTNELKREFKNNHNDPVVKAFDENPDLWIRAEIANRIFRLEKSIKKAKTGTERQVLQNRIISLEEKIPPIEYVLKKDALKEIKGGDVLLITENGNTVEYKIISIDTEKVRFQKEGQTLISFLSPKAMENFLLDPAVSFINERTRQSSDAKKEKEGEANMSKVSENASIGPNENTESKDATRDEAIMQNNYEQRSAEYERRLEENDRQQIEISNQLRETGKQESSPEKSIIRDNLWKRLNQLVQEEEEITEEWIAEDKKQKPFAYFVANQVDKFMLEHLTHKGATSLDLRFLKDDSEENFECISQFPIRDSGENNEYYAEYFEYNIAGFRKTLEDIDVIRTKDGFDIHSNNTRYMITGPDGTHEINIKGYDEATRIYKEATKKYLQKMRREFESSPENQENIQTDSTTEDKKPEENKETEEEKIARVVREIDEEYTRKKKEIIESFLKK
ncbi:MAG: hypothetical protein WC059_00300 [Candidatus Paceibacterota bacterium]